jgi:hypothetical protein
MATDHSIPSRKSEKTYSPLLSWKLLMGPLSHTSERMTGKFYVLFIRPRLKIITPLKTSYYWA